MCITLRPASAFVRDGGNRDFGVENVTLWPNGKIGTIGRRTVKYLLEGINVWKKLSSSLGVFLEASRSEGAIVRFGWALG